MNEVTIKKRIEATEEIQKAPEKLVKQTCTLDPDVCCSPASALSQVCCQVGEHMTPFCSSINQPNSQFFPLEES